MNQLDLFNQPSERPDPRLLVWRTLNVGDRVKVRCKYRRDQTGEVVERLDDLINGMGRYGVKLNTCPDLTTDFCRHELTRIKN